MAVTIGNIDVGSRINQSLRKLKSITFTGTGTSAATPDEIFGKLLAYEVSGGDAEWDFDLTTESDVEIYSSGNFSTTPARGIIFIAGTLTEHHPAIAGKIKCKINNTSTAAVVKIIYEEP